MISTKDFEFKQLLFVFSREGEKIAVKNDNIIVIDKEGKIIHQSTCYRIFAIFIVGNISITSVLIQKAKKYGFSFIFMTTTFRPYLCISCNGDGNTLLRKKQYEYTGLLAAKKIIKNKIYNQLMELESIRVKGVTILESIKIIKDALHRVDSSIDIFELMGNEGYVSKHYFKAFFDNIEWKRRMPRTKIDMVNALLDMGYTILFGFIESIVSVYGFDIYVGVLHRQFYMRKSLVCDLVEPFRIIIDRCVKKGINLKQFKESDFKVINNRWVLEFDKNAQYVNIFIKELLLYKNDIFKYIQDFYKSFMKMDFEHYFPWWER